MTVLLGTCTTQKTQCRYTQGNDELQRWTALQSQALVSWL